MLYIYLYNLNEIVAWGHWMKVCFQIQILEPYLAKQIKLPLCFAFSCLCLNLSTTLSLSWTWYEQTKIVNLRNLICKNLLHLFLEKYLFIKHLTVQKTILNWTLWNKCILIIAINLLLLLLLIFKWLTYKMRQTNL